MVSGSGHGAGGSLFKPIALRQIRVSDPGRPLDRVDRCVRQKSNLSRPLDRGGQDPLVFCAVAGNAPGYNLTPFRNEITERLGILVVYPQLIIHTETAYFAPLKRPSLTSYDHVITPCRS